MSTGLLRQINQYASDMDGAQAPVSADDVAALMDKVREVEPPMPARHRRRPQVAVILAAAAVVLLLAAIPVLLGVLQEDARPATDPTPTTLPSTTTSLAGTTTIATASMTVVDLPFASAAGWTLAEIETPVERGRLSVGWGPDGKPLASTAGFHCVDLEGAPKWNYTANRGVGQDCIEAGDATAGFVGHAWEGSDEWIDHAAFYGSIVYDDGVIGGLNNQVVCEPGRPSSQECAYWVSADGVNWFEPDRGTDEYHSMLHGEWSRDGDAVIVQVFAGPQQTDVTWYVSTDGGTTFPTAVAASDVEHAAVYTVDGRHHLLKWPSDRSGPQRYELDPASGWELVDAPSGLPGARAICPYDDCGPTARSHRLEDGTVWLVLTRRGYQTSMYFSVDDGATWIEPEPNTPAMPFVAIDTDAWQPVRFIGGWMLVRLHNDFHAVTNGTTWYRVPADWWQWRDPSRGSPTAYASLPIPPSAGR